MKEREGKRRVTEGRFVSGLNKMNRFKVLSILRKDVENVYLHLILTKQFIRLHNHIDSR